MNSKFKPRAKSKSNTTKTLLLLILVALFSCQYLVLNVAGQLPQHQIQPCPSAIQIQTTVAFRHRLHFICLNLAPPSLDVIDAEARTVVFSRRLSDSGDNQPTLMSSFVDYRGDLRIVVAASNKLNGTSLFSVSKIGEPIAEQQTINTQLVTAIAAFQLELTYGHQLAIANAPVVSHEKSTIIVPPAPIITMLTWRDSYFDPYQLIELPFNAYVSKIEPMSVNGVDFLLVCTRQALGQAVVNNRQSTTLIYKLQFADFPTSFEWKLYQELPLRTALDARAFTIQTKLNGPTHHYIVLLAEELPTEYPVSASTGPQLGLVLVKYFGGVFTKIKFAPAPYGVRLDAVSVQAVGSGTVIVVASTRAPQVQLFLYDGEHLTQIVAPTPHRAPLSVHLFAAPPQQPSSLSTSAKRNLNSKGGDDGEQSLLPTESWMPTLAISAGEPADDQNKTTTTASKLQPEEIDGSSNTTDDTNNIDARNLYAIPQQKLSDLLEFDEKKSNLTAANNQTIEKRQTVSSDQSDLLKWCRDRVSFLLSDNFGALVEKLQSLSRVIDGPDGPFVEIVGDVVVDGDLEVTERLVADSILEQPTQRYGPMPAAPIIYASPSSLLEANANLRRLNDELTDIGQHVEQMLVDDGSPQDVFAPVEFDVLLVECSDWNAGDHIHSPHFARNCPHVDELNTPNLNMRNVSNIRDTVLLTGQPITVNQDVRFEHLVLRGNAQINAHLNGLLIDDIVFKRVAKSSTSSSLPSHNVLNSGIQRFISGHKTFAAGLYVGDTALRVSRWNNVAINLDTVLSSSHDQSIDTPLSVDGIALAHGHNHYLPPQASSRIERINNMHLDSFLSSLVLSDRPSRINTPLNIDQLILDGPVELAHLLAGGRAILSGIDITELAANVLSKTKSQNISAPLKFHDLYMHRGADMHVHGLVNGIEFSRSNIITKSGGGTIPVPVTIDGPVAVQGNLGINRALNGIGLVPSPTGSQLAILLNVGDQLLTGIKVLDEIHLGGNSTISTPINGNLDLGQLYSLAVRPQPNDPFYFKRVTLDANNLHLDHNFGSLHISRAINGMPVNDVCRLAQYADSLGSQQVHYSRLRFEHEVNFKSIRCASINGISNLQASFLTRTDPQFVRGTVRLAGRVAFNSSLHVHGTFNSMDASRFANAIRSQLNETITQRKIVTGDLYLDDLFTDTIDELSMRDVLITNSQETQVLRAPFIVDDLDIESVLTVNGNAHFESFNHLNVSDILTNSLQYDTNQVITVPVVVNTLRILKGASLDAQTLNGVNLKNVLRDAVLIDVPQQIMATKTFVSPVEFRGKTYMSNSLNGLSAADLRLSNLLHSEDPFIDADLVFDQNVVVRKEMDIETGLLNDINLNLFANSLLHENRTTQAFPGKPARPAPMIVRGNGPVMFKDLMVNNLVVGGNVQGVDVSREASLALAQQKQQMLHNNASTRQHLPIKIPLPIYNVPYSHFDPQTYDHNIRTQQPQFMNNNQQHFNMSQVPIVWRPQPNAALAWTQPRVPQLVTVQPQHLSGPRNLMTPPKFFYQNNSRPTVVGDQSLAATNTLLNQQVEMYEDNQISQLARKIKDLSPLLMYYETVQKHEILGPVLHATRNPGDPSEGPKLVLKSVALKGEPCNHLNQKVAVLSQMVSQGGFRASSSLTETSNPILVDSVFANNRHFLFIANLNQDAEAQILVYVWDRNSARHELATSFQLPDYPTDLATFSLVDERIACIAIAQPRYPHQHLLGSPNIYCETGFGSELRFERKANLEVEHAFKLSSLQLGSQVLLGVLSEASGSQFGDITFWLLEPKQLVGSRLDMMQIAAHRIADRRLVRPTAVHLFEDRSMSSMEGHYFARAVVTEGSDSTESKARTRLYALDMVNAPIQGPPNGLVLKANLIRVIETQVLLASEHSNIQSVKILSGTSTLLFMQARDYIAIYGQAKRQEHNCALSYRLMQRLPLKGATKFVAFNYDDSSQYAPAPTQLPALESQRHFLVLSQDDCSSQRYSSVILASRFASPLS